MKNQKIKKDGIRNNEYTCDQSDEVTVKLIKNRNRIQIELVDNLSEMCTYVQYIEDSIVLTYGYGTIHKNDLTRIVNVCNIYGLQFLAHEREKCLDIVIDLI